MMPTEDEKTPIDGSTLPPIYGYVNDRSPSHSDTNTKEKRESDPSTRNNRA
jgi:hypothetical protein